MIKEYVAFDLETTGLSPETDQMIEIGALKVKDGKVVERFMEFVRPDTPIPARITEITGITNEMVESARDTKEIIHDFVEFCDGMVLIGHNILFDYQFSKKYANMYGLSFEKKGIDTLKIARKVHKDFDSKSLGALCAYYQILNQAAHRAYHDALATAKLYQCLSHYFEASEPKLFEPMQLQYKPKKVQPATKKQLDFLCALCEQRKIKLEKNPRDLSKSEASRMIDRIISGDISSDEE